MEILSFDIWDKFDDLLPPLDLHLPCLDLDFPVIDEIEGLERFLEPDVSEDIFSQDYKEKCYHLHDHSYASVMILGFNHGDHIQTKKNVKCQKTSLKIRSKSVNQLKNNEVFYTIYFAKFNFPFQLREIHNNQEKIRRALLNIRFDDLRLKLPKIQSAEKTLSKKSILDLAKIHCQKLENDLHNLKEIKRKLLKKLKNLLKIRSKLLILNEEQF